MTPHDRALELLALARGDEQAASVLETAAMGDALVGFHYQQAVEKLLKALLAEQNVDFPKTHDLVRLLRLARAESYDVPVVEEELARLAPFAVTLRYETVEEAKQLDRPEVQKLVRSLQSWVEAELL
jgi:HEPN domain-containing protein